LIGQSFIALISMHGSRMTIFCKALPYQDSMNFCLNCGTELLKPRMIVNLGDQKTAELPKEIETVVARKNAFLTNFPIEQRRTQSSNNSKLPAIFFFNKIF